MIRQVALLLAVAPIALMPVQARSAEVSETPLMAVKADTEKGAIDITLPKPDADGIAGRYIYLFQLETGVGSAAVGLDRGAAWSSEIVRFRRLGGKVVAEIENSRFIAPGGSEAEKKSVERSFATTILWVGDIKSTGKDGSITFDIAPFLSQDPRALGEAMGDGEGAYSLVKERSTADPASVKVFPKNAEFNAILTFRARKPASEMSNVSPIGNDVSIGVRHSFIALPEPGYESRYDPYGYAISRLKVDYSAPLGQAMVRDMATRFRLEKVDPSAASSPVKKPIVFHIDNAAPEPVRTALYEGVSWWAESFRRAGFEDAFKVEILPEGADALDVRYNVVNWVNRATRGWSYGNPVHDPRTGEIIKGTVMLGSLRVRQDILIFQALKGAGITGNGTAEDPIEAALARIRQLGAHEVGHALGFQHNFAASIQGRYSVMDYPAPRVMLRGGELSLSDAYGVGTGPWDHFVTNYLYGARSEAEAVAMAQQARAEGLRFVPDSDARSSSSAHPDGGLWDDFADPVAELDRMMAVRRAALERFSADAVPGNQQGAMLRRAFVPIWLIHRYQVEAAVKALGGVVTPIALVSEGEGARPVDAARQQAALDALMRTLTVEALTVPARLQPILSLAPGSTDDRQTYIEVMPTAGGAVFDPLKATEIAATHVLTNMLSAQRLNRLEQQGSADASVPSAHDVAERLIGHADYVSREGAIGRRIATTIAMALIKASRDSALSSTLALAMDSRLERWGSDLVKRRGRGEYGDWRRGLGQLLMDREAREATAKDSSLLPQVPPGMPIG